MLGNIQESRVKNQHKQPNRLIHEVSPYLVQHAYNPVDWFPWGEEALSKAKKENKPILLSIGYSACHWCHVMAHESFDNEIIAKLMNGHFVCIKVDREERPDLDEIYMAATMAMNQGRGGWPMTLFLTPDQKPFFAGTYFPPKDQHGLPGFTSLLMQIAKDWEESPQSFLEDAGQFTQYLRQRSEKQNDLSIGRAQIDNAIAKLKQTYDSEAGGFGEAPKFPPAKLLELILREYYRTEDEYLLSMVTHTLDQMAAGGIHDHLGGGFSRYCVDANWLIPHFEKMLYDNALLVSAYLDAFQVTKKEIYKDVAQGIFDFVIRELSLPNGGFYSSLDADTEGEEGKFYTWSYEEIKNSLSESDFNLFCTYYDITPQGNWEGKNILHMTNSLEAASAEVKSSLEKSKKSLFQIREQRTKPGRDDKSLTSWNSLMVSAFCKGYLVLGEDRYLIAAKKGMEFIFTHLKNSDGKLMHIFREGRAVVSAFLEDYAFLCIALIDLYEASAEEKYLIRAKEHAISLIQSFWDPKSRTFFSVANNHEPLYLRIKQGSDHAIPNPNAMAALALAKLSYYFDRQDFREQASQAIIGHGKEISQYPILFASSLIALDFMLNGPIECSFVGTLNSEDFKNMRREICQHFIPRHQFAYLNSEHPETEILALIGKTPSTNKTLLYICNNAHCHPPTTDFSALTTQIREITKSIYSRDLLAFKLKGKATPSGTAEFSKKCNHTAFTQLGSTGLLVSKIGFGSYRIDNENLSFRSALKLSLQAGCNVIDTASNYTNGQSEECIGSVVQELASMNELQREEIVIITKIGYVQGQNLKLAKDRESANDPFPEMVKYSQDCWHCVHPLFIKDQVERSLRRLQLETVDILLLHNPEYFFLAIEEDSHRKEVRDEFYAKLVHSFRYLEELASVGTIQYYGISSNTLGLSQSHPDSVSLSRIIEAAFLAGGPTHHFRVIQFPLNILESSPAINKLPSDGTLLELAGKNHIGVVINRPLNAVVDGDIVRLANAPQIEKNIDFDTVLKEVAEAEQKWRKQFASELKMGHDVFNLADQLKPLNGQVHSFAQWEQIESQSIVPHLTYAFQKLDSIFMQKGELEEWQAWKREYAVALDRLFSELESQAARGSRRVNESILKILNPLLPIEYQGETLSRKALWVLLSTPNVNCILNGMRKEKYVDDSMATLKFPLLENSLEIFQILEEKWVSLNR